MLLSTLFIVLKAVVEKAYRDRPTNTIILRVLYVKLELVFVANQ